MIKKIQKMFALTESGAKGLLRASFYSTLQPAAFMLPMMIVMLFAQGILEDNLRPLKFFITGKVCLCRIFQSTIFQTYHRQFYPM